jgi:hypothetical protein
MMDDILDACFNGDFLEAFCANCEDLTEEHGDLWCPVGDDPSNLRCARHGAFKEIEAIAGGARHDILGAVEQCCGEGCFV